jgi:hypothetical protein
MRSSISSRNPNSSSIVVQDAIHLYSLQLESTATRIVDSLSANFDENQIDSWKEELLSCGKECSTLIYEMDITKDEIDRALNSRKDDEKEDCKKVAAEVKKLISKRSISLDVDNTYVIKQISKIIKVKYISCFFVKCNDLFFTID